MPNGTPTGSGTLGDPYIIMDAQDLNSLRTKTGSTSAYTHVELGADIDMSVYASFTSISSGYFNIDGKNKRIYNLKINVGDSSAAGLIGYLYTQYTKDLTIEGEITGNYNYTYSMGMLAGKLYLANGNVTNVKCFGTLYANNVPQNIGGIAGTCANNSSGQFTEISDCMFRGTIIFSCTSGTSTSVDTSSGSGIGGILGVISPYGSSSSVCSITMKRCAAIFNAIIDMRGKSVGVGGLVRSIDGGTSSSNPRTAYIEECVARMKVMLSSVAVSTASLYVGGISAYNYEGINKITKCAAHLEMVWNPANLIQALYMAGFNCAGAGLTITVCYAVMKFTNKNGYPINNVNMYGTNYQGTCTINSSFFDLELLSSMFEGTINNTSAALTTEQLKSESFLTSKGWEFDG